MRGHGRLDGPKRVVVGDRGIEARPRASWSTPGPGAVRPPITGLAGTPYWTNREAIEAEVLPASLVVLGGGADRGRAGPGLRPLRLPGDRRGGGPPARAPRGTRGGRAAGRRSSRRGHRRAHRATATGVDHDGSVFTWRSRAAVAVTGERLLVATGRHVDLAAIGAESIGVAVDGAARCRWTTICGCATGVWAIGDITGKGAFTHMSMYQADIVVDGSPGPAGHAGRLPGRAPGHLHRSRDRIGGTERGSSARRTASRSGPGRPGARRRPGGGSTRSATTASSSWWRTPAAASSSEPRRPVPSGVRCSGLLTLAVHAEVPTERLRHMIYAYPTFHRGILDARRPTWPERAIPGSAGPEVGPTERISSRARPG